jgi:CheY-like chemotaxis protein
MLVDLLAPLGFDVVEATDRHQLLLLTQEIRPDLILFSRWTSGANCIEIVQQIRQIPELESTTIIAISTITSEEDRMQSQAAGIDAFLPEPVSWPRLAALLKEHSELEWEYDTNDKDGKASEKEAWPSPPSSPLVPPPKDELLVLHSLTLRGDMRGILAKAADIDSLGEQYANFANRLRELANGFEEQKIASLIKRYLESDP